MKRKVVGIFVCMLLIATVLPVAGMVTNKISETNNPGETAYKKGDFNLEVNIKPSRKILPRIYSHHIGNTIGFISSVKNKGPEVSPGGIVEFEIVKIFGKDTGQYYNETWDFGPKQPNSGSGTVLVWYPHNRQGKFGIFIARTTIEISDTNPNDNSKSFLFILIST